MKAVLLLGMVMTAGACGSDTTEPPPPPERLNNEIVFASDRDTTVGVSQLYRANADGSNVRLIDRVETGFGSRTSISPDGQWIATDGGRDIWKMRPDGTEVSNLTLSAALNQAPAWSPDGTRIAFHSDRAGQQFEWDVYVMDADGSNVTQITTHPAVDGFPTWAPDGSALAFWSRRDGNAEIYVVALDGSAPVNISNDPDIDDSPAWSPDGSAIAFRSRRDWPNPIWGLYLADPDGSNIRLVPLPFIPASSTWKPDGTRLLVDGQQIVGGVQTDFELWSVNPDGTNAINMTNNPASDRFASWSP